MRSSGWSLALLFIAAPIHAQVASQPPKNVQILTGLSRPELQRVMNEMAAGLGVHCHYCHATDNSGGASDTKPEKARAREMIRLTMDLNARNFGGKPVVTCFTCHNGKPRPAMTPPLPQPVPPEPVAPEAKAFPPLKSVLDKYVAAVGREPAAGTTRRFKGTHKSPTGKPIPMTIADTGDKWRADIQLPDGTGATQSVGADGGWARDKNGVRDMTLEEVVSARMSRRAYAPFYASAIGPDARVVDSEPLGGHTAWVVATPSARYWFDTDSGLLLRRVTYADSPVGRIPEQTDFDDYRVVGASKIPFLVRVSLVDPWLGGTRQAETIELGAPIDPAELARPGT
jgi:hypothetical protein